MRKQCLQVCAIDDVGVILKFVPVACVCKYYIMKTSVFVLILVLAMSATAADDDDIAAVYAAVPSARTITKTADGFRATTDTGKIIFVSKTSSGYRVAGEKNTTFIDKTSSGYRVSNGGGKISIDKAGAGYHMTGGTNTTFVNKTSDGYRIVNGQDKTVITKTPTGYRINAGRLRP